MSDKIPARFRKTKTEKWAVMAPVEDLERALAEGGKVDVLKKSGDWTTFRVGSLGRPFDVDGVQMCYGYAPEDSADADDASAGRPESGDTRSPARSAGPTPAPPPRDETEPLPEYQGGPDDEWSEF